MKTNIFKKDNRYSFNYEKFKEHFGEDENLKEVHGAEIQVLGKFAGRLLYHNKKVNTDVYRFVTPSMCDIVKEATCLI